MERRNYTRQAKNYPEQPKTAFENKKNGSSCSRNREIPKIETRPQKNGNRAGSQNVRNREKANDKEGKKITYNNCLNMPEEDLFLHNLDFDLPRRTRKERGIPHLMSYWSDTKEKKEKNQIIIPRNAYNNHKNHVKHVVYNKEHYLQANCQFVVSAGHDYSIYKSLPDELVEWDWIEEVWMRVTETPSCPICLYPPIAAQVTRCGHTFCYSCVLHYLALTDDKWRKCPICYEAIIKRDLKSVVTIEHVPIQTGDTIEMTLMRRQRDTLSSAPASACVESGSTTVMATFSSPDQVLSYAKLIVATKQEVCDRIIDRECVSLSVQLMDEEGAPEACFVQEAIALVNARKDAMQKQIGPDLAFPASLFDEEGLAEQCCGLSPVASDQIELETAFKNFSLDYDEKEQETKASSDFLFYQASNADHVYLHPLNHRMLLAEYGAAQKCPFTIKARVVEKESGTMNEAWRDRLRHLHHLPLMSTFEVVEIDLADLIAADNRAGFKKQLDDRLHRRKERAQIEEKFDRKAREEQRRMLVECGEIRPIENFEMRDASELASLEHFPSIGGSGGAIYKEGARRRMPSESELYHAELASPSSSPRGAAHNSFADMIKRKKEAKTPTPSETKKKPKRRGLAHEEREAEKKSDTSVTKKCDKEKISIKEGTGGGAIKKKKEKYQQSVFAFPEIYETPVLENKVDVFDEEAFQDSFKFDLDVAVGKAADNYLHHADWSEDAPRPKGGSKKKKKSVVLLSSGF